LRSSPVSALFAAGAARHLSVSFVPSPCPYLRPGKSISLVEAANGQTRTADAAGRQISEFTGRPSMWMAQFSSEKRIPRTATRTVAISP